MIYWGSCEAPFGASIHRLNKHMWEWVLHGDRLPGQWGQYQAWSPKFMLVFFFHDTSK